MDGSRCHADQYVLVNNSSSIGTNTTTLLLERHYNIPSEIILKAINCAGSSEQVTLVVEEGRHVHMAYNETVYVHVCMRVRRLMHDYNTWIVFGIPPSAGCSPPTPPVNGSVSGFTSSSVGAQVTYHCDTDLVWVGERVATCSQSLLVCMTTRYNIPADNVFLYLSPKSVEIQVYTCRTMYPHSQYQWFKDYILSECANVVCIVFSFQISACSPNHVSRRL